MALYTSFVDMKRGVSITPSGNRNVVVSGLVNITGVSSDESIYSSRCGTLLSAATSYFDSLLDIPASIDDDDVMCGMNYYSATPDDLPFVGRVSKNVFVNVGHGQHALAFSCGAGRLLSNNIQLFVQNRDCVSGDDNKAKLGNDKSLDESVSNSQGLLGLSPLRFSSGSK